MFQQKKEYKNKKQLPQDMEGRGERTTIYVGDLSPITVEADLLKRFSEIGTIIGIKLVKPDFERGQSKYTTCYAYITFESSEEAQNAVTKMNFQKLNGYEMRVMPYDQRMKAHVNGNVIVMNLDEKIDNRRLFEMFKVFGDILSCKVAVDNTGRSRGFGFVQFSTTIAAKKAILYGNGCKYGNSVVKVMKYDKKRKNEKKNLFTNVFMKNFPLTMTEEGFQKLLGKFGKVTSFFIPKKDDGVLRGYAFANFEDHKSAAAAVDSLHNTYPFPGEELIEPFYIQPGQSKSQRELELKKSIEKLTLLGQSYKRNLYVTNIPMSYTRKDVSEIFSQYGTIVSIRFDETGNSKTESNYAFICYRTPDEASIAVEKANELVIDGHRLHVDFYKSKKDIINERPHFSYPMISDSLLKTEGRGIFGRRTDTKQLNSDLYAMVLSVAQIYRPKWEKAGIRNEAEFAERVTSRLMERPASEVKNMIGLGNILNSNISETLNDINMNGIFKKK